MIIVETHDFISDKNEDKLRTRQFETRNFKTRLD
jgi:hypothetical protein